MSGPTRRCCDACGGPVPAHGYYVVRIDVFAEGSIPPTTIDEIEEMDAENAMGTLIEQMKGMSADELQDDVHRRFEYHVCRACQRRILVNPLGMPRTRTHTPN
jgi:hypothetical protein